MPTVVSPVLFEDSLRRRAGDVEAGDNRGAVGRGVSSRSGHPLDLPELRGVAREQEDRALVDVGVGGNRRHEIAPDPRPEQVDAGAVGDPRGPEALAVEVAPALDGQLNGFYVLADRYGVVEIGGDRVQRLIGEALAEAVARVSTRSAPA